MTALSSNLWTQPQPPPRPTAAIGRGVLVLAWMALQLWLLDLDRLPGLFLLAFGLGGFVVGYVVDRWWTLLVPALAIVVALIVGAIVPDDPHTLGESIPFIAIVLVCLVAIPALDVPLTLGILFRRFVAPRHR
jgi:hypothetical protein